jgi:hypothetical protein
MPSPLRPEIAHFVKLMDELRDQNTTVNLKKNLKPVITPLMDRIARFLIAFIGGTMLL